MPKHFARTGANRRRSAKPGRLDVYLQLPEVMRFGSAATPTPGTIGENLRASWLVDLRVH